MYNNGCRFGLSFFFVERMQITKCIRSKGAALCISLAMSRNLVLFDLSQYMDAYIFALIHQTSIMPSSYNLF